MRLFTIGQQKTSAVPAGGGKATRCHTAAGQMSPSQQGPSATAHLLIEKAFLRPMVESVDDNDAKISFEAALTQLEAIVDSMESGEVPLAELLAKFEDGNKLLKVCEIRLKDAELKIELLKKQKDGVAFTKFETSSEA